MGLLGKMTNEKRQGILGTRQVIADKLKQGNHDNPVNVKLNNIASNIENDHPIAATALRTITKFNDLTQTPFRKINTYLYNKIKPPTTKESDAQYIRNHLMKKDLLLLNILK